MTNHVEDDNGSVGAEPVLQPVGEPILYAIVSFDHEDATAALRTFAAPDTALTAYDNACDKVFFSPSTAEFFALYVNGAQKSIAVASEDGAGDDPEAAVTKVREFLGC